jgi:hypothetical protein
MKAAVLNTILTKIPVTAAQREAQLKADTTFRPGEGEAALKNRIRPRAPMTMEEMARLRIQQNPNDPRPLMFLNNGMNDVGDQQFLRNQDNAGKQNDAAMPATAPQHKLDLGKKNMRQDQSNRGKRDPDGFIPQAKMGQVDGIMRGFAKGGRPDNPIGDAVKNIDDRMTGQKPMLRSSVRRPDMYNPSSQEVSKRPGAEWFLYAALSDAMGGLVTGDAYGPNTEPFRRIAKWKAGGERVNPGVDPAVEAKFISAALEKADALARSQNAVGVTGIPEFGDDGLTGDKTLMGGRKGIKGILKTPGVKKRWITEEGMVTSRSSRINPSIQDNFLQALAEYQNAQRATGNDVGIQTQRERSPGRNRNLQVVQSNKYS